MQILMSKLPHSDWWGKGTPIYLNNWSMELGRIPDAGLTKKEHQDTMHAIEKYANIKTIPFPAKLDTEQLYKHDAVFVRDSFISNQKGNVVISNYAAKERQKETEHLKRYLKQNGYKISTLTEKAFAEGGEFYYIANGNILFSGVSRNNKQGVLETAKYLCVDELCVIASDSYHLDTIFTVILDKQGKLVGMIACLDLIKNKKELLAFARKQHLILIPIKPHDAIDFDGKGIIAVNCLPLPGVIIGGGLFETPGVEEKIKQMGIKHIIASVTQFHFSGGGTHCLTNELIF